MLNDDSRHALGSRRRNRLWIAAGLAVGIALTIFVWGQTRHFDFVWDDEFFVVKNTALRDWSSLPAYFYDRNTSAGANMAGEFRVFRPLRNLSYQIDFHIAGLNPAWWHLHQVLLHAINALLVGLLAGMLARSPVAGVVGGLLFLVHPVQTEVVAWVKCRDDLLSTFWTVIGFMLWLRWRGRPFGWGRSATLAAVYLLACLAKDQAIVLPLLLLAAERWLPPAAPERTARAGLRLWTLLAATGIVYLAWRHLFIGRTSQVPYLDGPAATLLTMLPVAVKYLQLLVCPWRLLADYAGMVPCASPLDPRVPGAIAVLALVAILVWRGRRRAPLVSFGLVWVVVALLPVSNLVPMMQYMAERFLYLPMIGFACAAGAAAAHAMARRRLVAGVAGVACAALIALAAVQARARAVVWRHEIALFTVTVRDTPDTVIRARRSLLAALLRAGQFAEARPIAMELWHRAEDDPSAKPRKKAEYARHLGMIALRTGDQEAGRAMLNRAIALDPTYVEPYLTLGVAAGTTGDHAAALAWFDRAVGVAPDFAAAHFNRGVSLDQLGRVKESEQAFRSALACHPDDARCHKALAALLWSRGRIAETIPIYAEAARLWPHDPEIQTWLANARVHAP